MSDVVGGDVGAAPEAIGDSATAVGSVTDFVSGIDMGAGTEAVGGMAEAYGGMDMGSLRMPSF